MKSMKRATLSLLLRVLGRGRQASFRVFLVGVAALVFFLAPYLALALGYRLPGDMYVAAGMATAPVVLLLFSKIALDGFIKPDSATGKSLLDQSWENLDEQERIKQASRRRQALSCIAAPRSQKEPPRRL